MQDNRFIVEKMAVNRETHSAPKQLTYDNVIYWSDDLKQLKGFKGSKGKALRFLKEDCIEETTYGYICKPIPGYNKTIHKMSANNNTLDCSCQGFQTKLKKEGNGFCCHVLSVMLLKKIHNWNNKHL